VQREEFLELLGAYPVIAAVKDVAGLEGALKSECAVIFTLYGNLLNIPEITARIKSSGKAAIVHMDFIEGLSARDISVDFVAQNTSADGIISTKLNLIKQANHLGILAVQRFFMLDSMAFVNIKKQYPADAACAIEILPGLMPKIIKTVCESVKEPVIAGGLIREKEDVVAALSAGAVAVSTTNKDMWNL
jgi:glycerol uptake operon antiterminator